VDETTIFLDQVSINSLFFQFKSLFMLWVSSFVGASTFKRSALGPRGFSYDRPHVHSGRVKTACVYMRLSSLQPVWTPLLNEKIKKKQGLTLLNLVFCKMYVHWRERQHEEVSELVGEEPNVVDSIMQCGLLKFFLCPFMWAQPRILNALVDY
jgi:hypothetical protein